MQTRHRIPTIFNLSMVDVLCCALGCVILLWLVYFKEAREKASNAGQSSKELVATKARLQSISTELTSAQQSLSAGKQERDYLSVQLIDAVNDQLKWKSKAHDADAAARATAADLKRAQTQVASLQTHLEGLRKLDAAIAEALKQKTQDHMALAAQLALAVASTRDLEKMVGDQKGQLAGIGGKASELETKLKDAQQKAAKLESQLSDQQTAAKQTAEQLTQAEARTAVLKLDLDKRRQELVAGSKRYDDLLAIKMLLEQNLAANKNDLAALKKELAEVKLRGTGLSSENKVLSQRVRDLEFAAEKRFAGIELTGQKVVFLVDMSGSMRAKDAFTEDPDKWPLICEIFGKLMASLPDLKQFQVIMFSDDIRYPLGGKGTWFEYRGVDTVKETVAALKRNMPEGGTNMSIAFEEVFRYRALGMDTIYFISDGLPNQGAGLPANAGKLTEEQKGIHLGKYIREKLKTTWNPPQGPGKQRVRINALGFFFDSPEIGAFLWTLARENDGGFVGMSKP